MRQTTKRKMWGRSAVASGLRICVKLLEEAAESAGKPVADPLVDKLQEAHKELGRVVEAAEIYRMPNKRLVNMIKTTGRRVETLLDIAIKSTPITQEEKTIQKRQPRRAR